uniref:Uncharacterized protein n=1 Tax=Takifugu rubripes TaxID=31033 RepID=A0A674NKS0_TAKRU
MRPTVIRIFTVPESCGSPPSVAVSVKDNRSCFSRSRSNLIPSAFECCFRAK